MPSYDFFTAKRYHKKLSWLFLVVFLLAIVLHALLLLLLCWLFVLFFTKDAVLSYWLFCLFGLFLYLAFGLLVGSRQSAGGGEYLARKLQAVRLFVSEAVTEPAYSKYAICVPKVKDLPSAYARFYEFATQMSIASGMPMPKLYVLPFESGINACVAGFDDSDRVLILTQGATQKLSSDGLYGLIAHEFAHMMHGDARLNVRIGVLLTALSWFYEMSEWLELMVFGDFYANYHNATSDKNTWLSHWQQANNKSPNNELAMALPWYVLLLVLRLIGLLGMATHEWVVSCFHRQRELLADATSVQLCRSFAIRETLTTLQTHSSELTHLHRAWGHTFFAPSYDTFFATHPTIEQRLDALNRHAFRQFGKQVTAHLDRALLARLHNQAKAYEAVLPMELEYHKAMFEPTNDKVVNGRLVVDPAFYDWGQQKTTTATTAERPTQIIDPEGFALPWLIVKHLRHLLGCLGVIECVLICRFARPTRTVDLTAVFATPSDTPLLAHTLDEALLTAIFALPMSADGIVIIKAINALIFHQKQPHHNATFRRYQEGLGQFLLEGSSQELHTVTLKHVGDLDKSEEKLYKACVLAMLCLACDVDCSTCPVLFHMNDCRYCLLSFLAGLQDNALLLGNTKDKVEDIIRLGRLANLPVVEHCRIARLLSFCYGLTVADLALMLIQLAQQKSYPFCQTLHTVVLYGKQSSHERDFRAFFDELL